MGVGSRDPTTETRCLALPEVVLSHRLGVCVSLYHSCTNSQCLPPSLQTLKDKAELCHFPLENCREKPNGYHYASHCSLLYYLVSNGGQVPGEGQ
jgi:hypothetical protein